MQRSINTVAGILLATFAAAQAVPEDSDQVNRPNSQFVYSDQHHWANQVEFESEIEAATTGYRKAGTFHGPNSSVKTYMF